MSMTMCLAHGKHQTLGKFPLEMGTTESAVCGNNKEPETVLRSP